jgi:acetyl-CoA carboxylase biotin carboxyl carrier protein
MKAKDIQELLDFIAKSGLEAVSIETEEIKLKVKKRVGDKIVTSGKVHPALTMPHDTTRLINAVGFPYTKAIASESEAIPQEKKKDNVQGGDAHHVAIKSPMIGTFYRSANPDAKPYVEVGDKISAGQTVCMVEAMKLFNEIESEITGTVVEILVEDASPIEYDQPLILVELS